MGIMRTHVVGALGSCALVALVGCYDDQDPEGARELLERMRSEDYRSWSRAPGYPERRASSAPHGDNVDIYINPIVEQTLAEGGVTEFPVGSIIAKDGFDDGGSLQLISAMEKRSDGWFWVEWDDSDDSLFSGRPAVCLDCHASGSDYVRAFSLPR